MGFVIRIFQLEMLNIKIVGVVSCTVQLRTDVSQYTMRRWSECCLNGVLLLNPYPSTNSVCDEEHYHIILKPLN